MKNSQKKRKPFELAYLAEKALKEAVQDVIKDHERTRDPLVIWRNGKVVFVPAKQLRRKSA